MSFLAIPLMGLAVSLVSVFLGLGGGILLVPLLPSLFGLSVHEAVATSLLTIVFVVSDNTYRFHQKKLVRWPIVFLMGPVSAVTAVVAAKLSQSVDSQIILKALLIILVLVTLRTFLSSLMAKNYSMAETISAPRRLGAIFGGALAGFTSGFAGVGAGVILSPLMIFLRAVKPEQLSPTANANMAFTTVAASLTFIASGSLVSWNQWGLIRWDISLGVFTSASLFSHFLRPQQNKLPFAAKTLLLSLLLIFLIIKISKQIYF